MYSSVHESNTKYRQWKISQKATTLKTGRLYENIKMNLKGMRFSDKHFIEVA
jgi:hypothetical protein